MSMLSKGLVNHKIFNMKKINAILFAGLALMAVSCKKYLDVNTNPNSATSTTPELILPQALVATAGNLNGFNSYGAQLGGYAANAGGYGGFGTSISYNFTSADQSGRWSTTYDNLEDYQYILNFTKGQPVYSYFAGVAQIMRVIGFQLLVDAYNDVPYTDALQGSNNLTPAYTDGKTIYKSLATELDSAIAKINVGAAFPGVTPLGASDVVFAGNMTKWKLLANTIKLRLIVRGKASGVAFANTTFSADGFLTTDALINPGFKRDNGRQNPKWNTWAYSYTGGNATTSWIATRFIVTFYNGTKIIDPIRGAATYYQYPAVAANRLGNEVSGSMPSCPAGGPWYPSTARVGASAGNASGALKGPTAGYPLMTAAEAYFLRAEAAVVGITTESAATNFTSGITSAFTYTLTKEDGTLVTPVAAAVTQYTTDNQTNPFVNFALNTTTAQKVEAIITQKYVAMNFVNSEEGWNEYRRTGYPTIVWGTNAASDITTFASVVSESTAADKLPTRIVYPSSEGQYNGTNMPKGISPFTSKIFWAK